jgi:hypothetical protein
MGTTGCKIAKCIQTPDGRWKNCNLSILLKIQKIILILNEMNLSFASTLRKIGFLLHHINLGRQTSACKQTLLLTFWGYVVRSSTST